MDEVRWDRYPLTADSQYGRKWLTIQVQLGRAPNTVAAYGRALEDFMSFCARTGINPVSASQDHIAVYVHDLTTRPSCRRGARADVLPRKRLANATLQQRPTALRLYYDYLIDQQLRSQNPIRRGRFTPGNSFQGQRDRGLIPHYTPLPWIPTNEQWVVILDAARKEPIRNRMMFALAYEAALRREELCTLAVRDIDPARHLVTIRAENTKNRQTRVVPFWETTNALYVAYLRWRRNLSREAGQLFLSESRRNRAQGISIWTWTKVVEQIAERAGVEGFTTHTLRHLRLTDLALAGWDIHDIATFAGHRSIQTTMIYIHLSGRDLATKLERSMQGIQAWRMKTLVETLA